MDVSSMLKSKHALVPCRNFIFGKRLSLTAMEKTAVLPLRAGFMPKSPMPMLDVCEGVLLLMTATTTGGGSRLAEGVSGGGSRLAARVLVAFCLVLLLALFCLRLPRTIVILPPLFIMVVGARY
jgi:hypothetical protein